MYNHTGDGKPSGKIGKIMNEDDSKLLKDLENQFFFSKSKEESDKILAQIVKLIPNDYDLGSYIRYLYANKFI